MPDARTLTREEIILLAGRLGTASGSIRLHGALRRDLAAAAALITTLIRTGVIAGSITLGDAQWKLPLPSQNCGPPPPRGRAKAGGRKL